MEQIDPSQEQPFHNIEQQDGTRFTWNIWNTSPARADSVPLACLYNIKQPSTQLEYEPIFCSKCQAVLNPYAYVDAGSGTWTCTFCNGRNQFPKDTDLNNLLELSEEANTVEYVLNKQSSFPPVFLILIDTATYDMERHDLMITSVLKAIEVIPDDAMVGIIQYGTNVNVLTFGDEPLKTIYQFSGDFDYHKKNVRGMEDIRQFLVKKEDKKDDLIAAVKKLKQDPFPTPDGFRPNRCTGSAISFAVSFLEGPFAENPVKYLLFTQGACTYGPGATIPREIATDAKVDLDKAAEFYKTLGLRPGDLGHSIDVFGETIADIGYEQMRNMVESSGGAIIFAQDFEERIVLKSLEMLYSRDEQDPNVLSCGFNAKIQVRTTPNVKVKSFAGDGSSKGTGWRIGAIIPTSNLTIVFEPTEATKPNSYAYAQILTQYTRSDRRIVLKVTTFARLFSTDKVQLTESFDVETATVTQARLFLMHPFENIFDMETAIDKHLIRFTKRFASWDKNNPDSVALPYTMTSYLNFMFFFRRSFIIQTDGISSDESAYFKTLICKLRVGDAMKLIKPTLIGLNYTGDAFPVELSIDAMSDDVILIMDSFHNVLRWDGVNIYQWKKEGLQNQAEYAFFKKTLEDAEAMSLNLLENRFPAPQFKETSAGKSQERILMTYLCSSGTGTLNTQKIDYGKFYSALCKHIVSND